MERLVFLGVLSSVYLTIYMLSRHFSFLRFVNYYFELREKPELCDISEKNSEVIVIIVLTEV